VILEVNGLSFAYKSRDVLRNIRFNVERGEVLAILGPNGVGKTTLLKCINAILRPCAGSVLVSSESVFSLGSTEIAHRIGYVAQRAETSRLIAFDAILMGRHPHINWKVSDEDLAVVDAAIKLLDLGHLAMRYIDQISGGELQKVALARALVQEPRLLLLDEPTSNLDLKNQVEILKIIRRVVKEHEVSAVMTMHDLNKALRYADKYLFLKEGVIYDAGEVGRVTAETVQAVYGLPVEIHYYKGNPVVLPLEEDDKM
jgi:iron complex transport system ATP-binding protein